MRKWTLRVFQLFKLDLFRQRESERGAGVYHWKSIRLGHTQNRILSNYLQKEASFWFAVHFSINIPTTFITQVFVETRYLEMKFSFLESNYGLTVLQPDDVKEKLHIINRII